MNIFKVLASGKKSFQEETASAILAWLLNPAMEHGLGYSFIQKFLNDIFKSIGNGDSFSEFSKKLVPRLRSEEENQRREFWLDLEYSVDNAFIDILIGIDNWIFAIENKIYARSTTKGQLVREYDGLKKKIQNLKIGMIYLVPIEGNSEIIDAKTANIFDELQVTGDDFKVIVTWQKNNMENTPSIADLIEKSLDDETKGIIDPIPEYTRHTLKALNSFILNGFSGYEYEKQRLSSRSVNPLTEKRLSLNEIQIVDRGFVGVKDEVSGLLRMPQSEIKKYKFQYTSQDMSRKRNWIDIKRFKAICAWIIDRKIEEIDWDGTFRSDLLYKIAKDYKKKVFIGIKGGEKALKNMASEAIKEKSWGISTEQSSSQWIDGEVFCTILKEKGLYQ